MQEFNDLDRGLLFMSIFVALAVTGSGLSGVAADMKIIEKDGKHILVPPIDVGLPTTMDFAKPQIPNIIQVIYRSLVNLDGAGHAIKGPMLSVPYAVMIATFTDPDKDLEIIEVLQGTLWMVTVPNSIPVPVRVPNQIPMLREVHQITKAMRKGTAEQYDFSRLKNMAP